jgi:hypothetical protein
VSGSGHTVSSSTIRTVGYSRWSTTSWGRAQLAAYNRRSHSKKADAISRSPTLPSSLACLVEQSAWTSCCRARSAAIRMTPMLGPAS